MKQVEDFVSKLIFRLTKEVKIEDKTFVEENRFISKLWKGKFLRSKMVYHVYKAFSDKLGLDWEESALRVAMGLEVIHLASLIHDDIIDKSTTRRGLVSFHCKFGESAAIVWGDWLFAYGVENFSKIGAIFSGFQAVKSICVGQLLEEKLVHYEDISWNSYYKIIAYKTASLFSIGIDALKELNMDSELVDKYADYAFMWGLCFQIYDDLLDFQEDFLTKKLTFPVLLLKDWGVLSLELWQNQDADQLLELNSSPELLTKVRLTTKTTIQRMLELLERPVVFRSFDLWLRDKLSKLD